MVSSAIIGYFMVKLSKMMSILDQNRNRTVEYPYFQYVIDGKNDKSYVLYFSGPTNVRLIGAAPCACDREEMGQPDQGQAKEPPVAKTDATQNETSQKSRFKRLNWKTIDKKTCCRRCLDCLFVVLAVIVIIVSIATIVAAISTAIATKIYSSEHSGRVVAMIAIAVTAAVTISMAVYAMVGLFSTHNKPLHAAAVVLIIMAIIQAVICGISVSLSPADEASLRRSLSGSFNLALGDNLKHVKIWSSTSYELKCCGFYSPEDYRRTSAREPAIFPPNIPITCCPNFDPDRSELVQEKERQYCRAQRTYYGIGCGGLVIDVFRETASLVLSVAIILIVLEVLLTILASVFYKKLKHLDKDKMETEAPPS